MQVRHLSWVERHSLLVSNLKSIYPNLPDFIELQNWNQINTPDGLKIVVWDKKGTAFLIDWVVGIYGNSKVD